MALLCDVPHWSMFLVRMLEICCGSMLCVFFPMLRLFWVFLVPGFSWRFAVGSWSHSGVVPPPRGEPDPPPMRSRWLLEHGIFFSNDTAVVVIKKLKQICRYKQLCPYVCMVLIDLRNCPKYWWFCCFCSKQLYDQWNVFHPVKPHNVGAQ